MKIFSTFGRMLAWPCQCVGVIALLAMVLVTMTDVITRFLFSVTGGSFTYTVKGSVELVSYLMLFALTCALTAYLEKSQIVVDVFTHRLSKVWQARVMGVCLLGYVVVGVCLCLGMLSDSHDAAEYGETTMDLGIPMGPIYAVSAVIFAVFTLRAFVMSLYLLTGGEYEASEEAV